MRSVIRSIALTLLGLAIAMPVFAADKAKIEKMLVAMKIDAAVAQMHEILFTSMQAGFAEAASNEGLSEAQIEKARPALDTVIQSIKTGLSWEAMKDEMVEVYAQELTDAEVEAAIGFYSTPEGQSLLSKQPVLMQRGAEIGQRRMRAMIPALQADMQKLIDEAKRGE
jgi:hypothetical protein